MTTVRAEDDLLDPPLATTLPGCEEGAIGTGWLAVIALALAAGIVFRLMLPGIIEYHGDEKFTFEHVMAVLDGGAWPPHGMKMSIGGPNPGMSVWVFVVLGLLFRPETPPDLAQAVQFLNVAALLAFLPSVDTGATGNWERSLIAPVQRRTPRQRAIIFSIGCLPGGQLLS